MPENRIIDLNGIFNNYFFKKFTFILDNKIIKQGRLKLFSMKGFNLKFFLIDNENQIKNIELPYPFLLTKSKTGYVFDYRIEKFKLLPDSELIDTLCDNNTPKSRYYDKPLIVQIE